MVFSLVEESRLLIFNTEFAVNCSQNALHLSEGEHTSQQRIAGIVAMARFIHDAAGLVGEGHTVVNAHGQFGIFFLENAAKLDEVGTSSKVTGFREVAVGEDMTRTKMHKVGA